MCLVSCQLSPGLLRAGREPEHCGHPAAVPAAAAGGRAGSLAQHRHPLRGRGPQPAGGAGGWHPSGEVVFVAWCAGGGAERRVQEDHLLQHHGQASQDRVHPLTRLQGAAQDAQNYAQ